MGRALGLKWEMGLFLKFGLNLSQFGDFCQLRGINGEISDCKGINNFILTAGV